MARKVPASIEDAFLQTVLDDPDSDTPRLVFADWLEEQGNPRGAFIRLQCQRASMTPHDPGWKNILAQESALLKQFQSEWSLPVRRLVDDVEYRRGFIAHVRVSAAKLMKNAERLFRLAPVCSIRLERPQEVLPHIADAPWLIRVKELDMSNEVFGTKNLQTLLRSEFCRSLRLLRLHRCVLHTTSAQVLAEAANLQSLHALDLHENTVGSEGTQMLARSIHLKNLRELNLSGNQLQVDGVIALAAAPTFRLTRLALGSNRVGNEGAAAIARCAPFAELRHLNLEHNAVGNLGVEALVQSPHLTRLEHLNLYHNHISSRGVQLLTDSALLANLSYLNLKSNEIDKQTMQTLPVRLLTPQMRELLY